MDAFERAVFLDPEFTLAYSHIFDIYREQELYKRGISTASRFVELYPNNKKGYENLSLMYRFSGKNEEAIDVYKKEKLVFPEKQLSYQLKIAKEYMRMGRYSLAFDICNDILSADDIDKKSKVSVFRVKGAVYDCLGEYSKAIEMREKALEIQELNDEKVASFNYLGMYLLQSGNYEKAIRYLDQGLELKPSHPARKDFMLYWKGYIYAKQSDDESLTSTINLLKKRNAMENAYNALLAERFLLQGNVDSALVVMESIKNNLWEYHYPTMGILYSQNGDYKRALQYADKMQATNIWTYDFCFSRGYYIRGLTYEAMGNFEKASENYKALLELWENADDTIPELIDTKIRFEKLKKTS